MDLEIHRSQTSAPQTTEKIVRAERSMQERAKEVSRKIAQESAETSSTAERSRRTKQYLDEILSYTQYFNKRLKFSVNEQLDQVVVKVIDTQTDKVIKEIPPEVLQRLHVRIREAIGLLIDESI